MNKEELIAWMDGLADWKVFFTASPAHDVGCRAMVSMYEKFMSKHYPNVSYVYSIEPYKGRGWHTMEDFYPAVHMHAMFDGGHDIRWKDFWDKWFKLYGRAKTEPIRHKADVATYVSEYILKEQGDESGNERKELWWDVKLSRLRKRERGIIGSGLSRRTDQRENLRLTPAV